MQLSIVLPQEQNRILALFSIPFFLARYILAIPVIICLYVVGIAAAFVAWFGQWAILFTGHNSPGFQSFLVGYLRWSLRLTSWMLGLTDAYPGFSMQP